MRTKRPESTSTTDPVPSFEVEIKSGGRAYDLGGAAKREPVELSPARAAAKARAQRRRATFITLISLLLAAILGSIWLSNPDNFAPSDAVARVNGEYITSGEISREIDLTKVSQDLAKMENPPLPSAASILEDLIVRKLKVQDARKAGVTVSPAEIEEELGQVLKASGLTESQFEAALGKYNLSLDDLRILLGDTRLVNKYVSSHVLAGTTIEEARKQRVNDWQTDLAQKARIDRLRAAGSGRAPRVGSEAPDFILVDLTGKEVQLGSLRGRPVMVNFWATWCPPCRAEIPEIVKVYEETHKGDNYEILGVATQSDKETVQAFAREFKMSFPVLPDQGSAITSLYHVLPIPTTFFIDEDGIIRHIQLGLVDRSLMEKWLLNRP